MFPPLVPLPMCSHMSVCSFLRRKTSESEIMVLKSSPSASRTLVKLKLPD